MKISHIEEINHFIIKGVYVKKLIWIVWGLGREDAQTLTIVP